MLLSLVLLSCLQGQSRIFWFTLKTLQLIKKKPSRLSWAALRHQQSTQPRLTYNSLELLLSESHVFLHDAIVLVNGGVEDEGVIRVQGIVGTVLLKSVRKSG